MYVMRQRTKPPGREIHEHYVFVSCHHNADYLGVSLPPGLQRPFCCNEQQQTTSVHDLFMSRTLGKLKQIHNLLLDYFATLGGVRRSIPWFYY